MNSKISHSAWTKRAFDTMCSAEPNMLTRSFLFLLALMTGFSAATAAEASVRFEPSQFDTSKLSSGAESEQVEAAENITVVAWALMKPAFRPVMLRRQMKPVPLHQLGTYARVFIGDRSRQ